MVYAVFKRMGVANEVTQQWYYLGDYEADTEKAAIAMAFGGEQASVDPAEYRTYDASTCSSFEARQTTTIYVQQT